MARKKKRDYLNAFPWKRSRVLLIKRIVIIYFATLLSLVFLILKFNIPLYASLPGGGQVPTNWLWAVRFYCYIVPFLFALLLGIMFKPFWQNFRNLLTTIFVIHCLYSVVVFGFRFVYLHHSNEDIRKTKLANLKVTAASHWLYDGDKDGIIERIEFAVKFDLEEFPPGEYWVYAVISQYGIMLPDNAIGVYRLETEKFKPENIIIRYEGNPQVFADYFANGDFELNLKVKRIVRVDRKGKLILAFARWAPFFKFISWDGKDPSGICNKMIDVDLARKVDIFTILPLRL